MPQPDIVERAEIEFTGMAFGGEAVGRRNGEVVFVPFVLPGERATIEFVTRKKKFSRASVIELHERAPERTTAPCPYFRRCGGCQWQHADYAAQLAFKRAIVQDQLARIGGFADVPVHPTVPSPQPFHYRNNARFTIHGRTLGFQELGSRRFLQIDYCYLMHPRINEVLATIQGRAEAKHQVSIRHGYATDDLLIHPALPPELTPFPSGQPYYYEALGGHRFRVSGPSFFQVNVPQAENLCRIVRDYLDLQGDEVLVDAFSGVGTFAVILSDQAKRIIAIEESKTAVDDALENILGHGNIEPYLGKTEAVLPEIDFRVDAVILDPARVGCHPRVIEALLRLAPKRIVYVSCDPSTLARDLKLLCADGHYRLVQVQPLDMFPQTYHIECVAQVDRV